MSDEKDSGGAGGFELSIRLLITTFESEHKLASLTLSVLGRFGKLSAPLFDVETSVNVAEAKVADVVPVEQHGALVRVVQPREQSRDRALA